jgi:hypothetical protein
MLILENATVLWLNSDSKRCRFDGNDLRNVATLLLIPDTAPLSASRKVSNFLSADATRVVSHGAKGSLLMRPCACGNRSTRPPGSCTYFPNFTKARLTLLVWRASWTRAACARVRRLQSPFSPFIGKASYRHEAHLDRSLATGARKAETGGKVTQRGFACLQFRTKEQRHHRLGLGFQPKGRLCARA